MLIIFRFVGEEINMMGDLFGQIKGINRGYASRFWHEQKRLLAESGSKILPYKESMSDQKAMARNFYNNIFGASGKNVAIRLTNLNLDGIQIKFYTHQEVIFQSKSNKNSRYTKKSYLY